mmetsp:Transcript_2143/g.5938  ORF Transcript_2143/g.5938 Transcript_2143/m.5938 type:complete len:130 (+) Transcript_2143:141-530(+)
MGRYRRKKNHNKNKLQFKTKAYKANDQIFLDLQDGSKPDNPRVGDDDLPAQGQHYCVVCSRYFVSESTLEVHRKSKLHKRQQKLMEKGDVYVGPEERIDNGGKVVRNGEGEVVNKTTREVHMQEGVPLA